MSDPLEKILENTLRTIETCKEEIFSITESNRTEVLRITQELNRIRIDVNEVIKATDEQRNIEKKLRHKLMEVNRDFKLHSETNMIDTYKETTEAQIKLHILESKEKRLRAIRDNLERSLKQIHSTIERAENVLSHICFTISLLEGEIANASSSSRILQHQDISLRIIKAQEDERRRVAREIHDGPAQTLANIVLRLEIAERLLELSPQKAKTELDDLKNLVRSNLHDIRRIIFDLRPMALDDLGIVQAINQYLKNFQLAFKKIECELNINGLERRLPQVIEVSLFRLIQEGLTNIAKHSRSERAVIDFHFREKSIYVKIIDFGKGFNVENTFQSPGEHYGLIGMRERVEMFSGHLDIRSSPGKGTTIEITIPY